MRGHYRNEYVLAARGATHVGATTEEQLDTANQLLGRMAQQQPPLALFAGMLFMLSVLTLNQLQLDLRGR